MASSTVRAWCFLVAAVATGTARASAQNVGAADDGQGRPFLVTVGVALAPVEGSTRCLTRGYFVPGIEVRSRGRAFVSAGVERFVPGISETCIYLTQPTPTPDGTLVRGDDRFELPDGGTHFGLGGGLSISPQRSSLEVHAQLGALRGQDDFEGMWMPSATVGVGAGLLGNHLAISFGRRWFDVPHWEKRYAPGDVPPDAAGSPRPTGATTERTWKAVYLLSLGFRF